MSFTIHHLPAARSPAPASGTPSVRLPRQDAAVIGALLASTFVVVLSETTMGVAIPPLMRELDVPAASAQWLTTGFMLTMAIVIPVTGFLLRRFPMRQVYLAAMALFLGGTVLSAIAPGFEALLAGRIVQATGTAIITPLMLMTVATIVPPVIRGRTMGGITIVMAVAPAAGPAVSGIILDELGWRWLFWLTLPVAGAALTAGIIFIRNVTTPGRAYFDVLSAILAALGLGGVVYGLAGLGSTARAAHGIPGWVPLAVGGIGLAWFAARQLHLQRDDRALVDLRTFGSPTFAATVGLLALTIIGLFGALLLLPLYLQEVLGLTAAQTGLLLLPGGLTVGLLAPLIGRIYDRHGPTAVLPAGTVIVSAAFWALTRAGQRTPYGWAIAAHILLSTGIAFLVTPLFTAALGATPARLYSHASAILNTIQQVAGAAGGALFVTIMSTTAARLISEGTAKHLAVAEGTHAAFLTAALLSLAGIALGIGLARSARRSAAGAPSPQRID